MMVLDGTFDKTYCNYFYRYLIFETVILKRIMPKTLEGGVFGYVSQYKNFQ